MANTKDCTLGWCAYDGRRELPRPDGAGTYRESYCTADCTKVGCLDGWECVDAAGDGVKVCLKEVAVCGDARMQPDETCDDGNTYERDGCSADCKKRHGAQLVVEKLTIGGTTSTAAFTTLPEANDNGSAAVDAISSVAFRLKFILAGDAAGRLIFEMEMPRRAGVVDLGATSPFYVSISSGSFAVPQTKPATLEILEAGADGRSYRAKLTADYGKAVTSSFVVTLP